MARSNNDNARIDRTVFQFELELDALRAERVVMRSRLDRILAAQDAYNAELRALRDQLDRICGHLPALLEARSGSQ